MRRCKRRRNLALERLPAVVGAEIAWALATIAADAGRTTEAVAAAEAGYAVATRSFDAPQMRFNIADAHVSALLLSGRIGGRRRRGGAGAPAGGRPAGSGSIARCCSGGAGRARRRPPRHRVCAAGAGGAWGCPAPMPSAGDTGITSHGRLRSRCAGQLTRLPPRSPRSTRCDALFGSWTTS